MPSDLHPAIAAVLAETPTGRAWTGPERSKATLARLQTRARLDIAHHRRQLLDVMNQILAAEASGRAIRPSWLAKVERLKSEIAELEAQYPATQQDGRS
jgi:hypothetical protein